MDSFIAKIAEAQEAAAALAEHERLQRLAGGLDALIAAQEKAQKLDALWDELCQAQAYLRANVQEALVTVPEWRRRFIEAHGALLSVVSEVDAAQAPILRAGDALKRAYRLEKQIQGLQGQGERGTTVQLMWQSAGGDSLDLDPLKGLVDPGLQDWLTGRGIRFLYRPSIGLRHFFRG